MIKKVFFLLFLVISTSLFSQEINLDKYQYIIVLDKFGFLKTADEYQTSSLTKFLLKKKGFKVFLSNEKLPKEVIENRCLTLSANVKDESSMFYTKSIIEIKDCFNNVLYSSKIGKSRLKVYKKAYQEAIRNAYDTMEDFKYSYNPNLIVEDKKSKKLDTPVIITPKVIITPEVKKTTTKKAVSDAVNILYAQPKKNGFQLVNMKPEVVFLVLKTNVKDVFVIKDKNGIFYKIGEKWGAEYYENNLLVKKEFEVKF